MHLSPYAYHVVQCIAHGNYGKTLKKLERFLDASPGDIVVEVGCGDSGFAKYFINHGCKYYGIDSDEQRIKIAQKKIPEGFFICADLMNFDFSTLPTCNNYFCYGVLHHLDDNQCNKLIKKIMVISDNIKFVAMEPIRPFPWYTNPIATFCVNMDDGNYIRTYDSWTELYGTWLKKSEIKSELPRWPVRYLFALLVPQHKTID